MKHIEKEHIENKKKKTRNQIDEIWKTNEVEKIHEAKCVCVKIQTNEKTKTQTKGNRVSFINLIECFK